MQAKTMEGLIGARNNINIAHVPVRIYKDAERRGDLATMERAAGYAGEFTLRAEEYKSKADEGMAEEAKEAKKEEETRRENAAGKRRAEREEMQEQIEESREKAADSVEISEEGKLLSEDIVQPGTDKEPVIYNRTGETVQAGQVSLPGISLSI